MRHDLPGLRRMRASTGPPAPRRLAYPKPSDTRSRPARAGAQRAAGPRPECERMSRARTRGPRPPTEKFPAQIAAPPAIRRALLPCRQQCVARRAGRRRGDMERAICVVDAEMHTGEPVPCLHGDAGRAYRAPDESLRRSAVVSRPGAAVPLPGAACALPRSSPRRGPPKLALPQSGVIARLDQGRPSSKGGMPVGVSAGRLFGALGASRLPGDPLPGAGRLPALPADACAGRAPAGPAASCPAPLRAPLPPAPLPRQGGIRTCPPPFYRLPLPLAAPPKG